MPMVGPSHRPKAIFTKRTWNWWTKQNWCVGRWLIPFSNRSVAWVFFGLKEDVSRSWFFRWNIDCQTFETLTVRHERIHMLRNGWLLLMHEREHEILKVYLTFTKGSQSVQQLELTPSATNIFWRCRSSSVSNQEGNKYSSPRKDGFTGLV